MEDWVYFLIRCDTVPQWGNSRPLNWITTKNALVAKYAERARYDGNNDPLPAEIMSDPVVVAAGGYQVGGFFLTGDPHGPIDSDVYQEIFPLGNYTTAETGAKAGKATKHLRSLSFQGAKQEKWGDATSPDPILQLYPADNAPFGIEIRHKYFGGNANPAWDGWGWRAQVQAGATARDIANRAIGIYYDDECTNYWYTTGKFTLSPDEWNGGGDVYATEYNPAFLTGVGAPNPTDHHHALLLGSAQEGYETLSADEQADSYLYWKETRGKAQTRTLSWVDTGVKVLTNINPKVYGVTDSSVFSPGDKLRINNIEVRFVREGGNPNVIIVSKQVTRPVNKKVYRWE